MTDLRALSERMLTHINFTTVNTAPQVQVHFLFFVFEVLW